MTTGAHYPNMSDGPRALLTPRERDALRDDTDDMTEATRNSLLNRVERKIREKMATDARIIREYDDELAEILHEAVCDEETDERLAALEEEVAEIRDRLDGDGDGDRDEEEGADRDGEAEGGGA